MCFNDYKYFETYRSANLCFTFHCFLCLVGSKSKIRQSWFEQFYLVLAFYVHLYRLYLKLHFIVHSKLFYKLYCILNYFKVCKICIIYVISFDADLSLINITIHFLKSSCLFLFSFATICLSLTIFIFPLISSRNHLLPLLKIVKILFSRYYFPCVL